MKRTVIAIILTAALLLAAGTVPVLAQNFQGMNTLQNIASASVGLGLIAIFVILAIIKAIMAFT